MQNLSLFITVVLSVALALITTQQKFAVFTHDAAPALTGDAEATNPMPDYGYPY